MDQIAAYLKDPAWWFSAFFVAIIASIVAAFAKDYVQSAIARVSTSARTRLAARSARQGRIVEALSQNETFLLATLIRSVALLVLMCTLIVLFMLAPTLSDVLSALCNSQEPAHSCQSASQVKFRSSVLYALLGSLTIFSNWRAMSVASLAMRGLRRYRNRLNLPPVN